MPIQQKTDLKELLRQRLMTIIALVRASSPKARLIAAVPVIAALLLAGAAVLLDIYGRGAGTAGWGFRLAAATVMFVIFLAPLWFAGHWLYRLIRPRLRERRFLDALRVGIYLPHCIAVLVIVSARLGGSGTIATVSAAIITWAMLSLLLTPFVVLLTLLAWSFLPSDEKIAELRDRSRDLGARAKMLLPSLPAPARHDRALPPPSATAESRAEEMRELRT